MFKQIMREIPWLLILFMSIGAISAFASKDPEEVRVSLWMAGGCALLLVLFFAIIGFRYASRRQ